MKTIDELEKEMIDARHVYAEKKIAYEEAQKQQRLDEYGLAIGDIVTSRGVIFKLSRTDNIFFYGHKKTKSGWHKAEQFIHPVPTKVVE